MGPSRQLAALMAHVGAGFLHPEAVKGLNPTIERILHPAIVAKLESDPEKRWFAFAFPVPAVQWHPSPLLFGGSFTKDGSCPEMVPSLLGNWA